MDVVISGSTGLIGTALARSLRADGHRVLPLTRSDPKPGETALRWEIDRGEIDRAGLEGVDAVVHLAGEGIAAKRWSDDQKKRVLASRTRGTALLADTLATLDLKPRVMVSASAVGYYGDRGDTEPTEASGPGHGFLTEVCVAWEAAADRAEAAGIRVARIRTGIVLSAEGGALAKQLPLFKLGVGGKLGSGRQYQSWISIDDEVGAIRFLLDPAGGTELEGPVNLTGPEPVTNAAFTRALGSVLSRPAIVPVPSFAPKVLLGSELAEQVLFASQRALPAALDGAAYRFRHRDVTTALRAVLGRGEEVAR